MWDDLKSIDARFVHKHERTRHITFPLGGVGSGGMVITGSGRLEDWSIRNRPAMHQSNGYSHFAIKAEDGDSLVDARVLNGPYDDVPSGGVSTQRFLNGYGFGANRASLAGAPHFKNVDFIGRFPVADLVFEDKKFPGAVRLTAFSPFIPHNDRDSAMPVAMFTYEIANTTDKELTYTIAGTLGNYGVGNGRHTFSKQDGVAAINLTSFDEPKSLAERGDLTIATDADDVRHQNYHFRSQWFDDLNVFWRDFTQPGPLPERQYDTPRDKPNMFNQPEHATLAARVTVPAGQTRQIRFVISWNFPHGEIYWFNREKPDSRTPPPKDCPTWKNYYATQWQNSLVSAQDALQRWEALEGATTAFRDGFFNVTTPVEIVDAASSSLALLRTATVFRLEGGELWGWEGQHPDAGSCEGTCTHVWNYQQALPFLFPALERTLRETELTYSQREDGGLTFRQRLPLGTGFDVIGPCADGHFGAVIKTYRDWKNSGDTAWLKEYWTPVKRAVEYAWSDANPDKWDPDQTGILWGRQHHTLDMELFGPNAWLSTFYIAALYAASEMAFALGDAAFGEKCKSLADKGAKFVNTELFDGQYFIQQVDLADIGLIKQFDEGRSAGVLSDAFLETYWSDEHQQVKYQTTNGCVTDQILGQWHANIAGLPTFLEPEKMRSALAAVYKHNFRPTLEDHFNPCRVYAYEDEAGLLLMTWPDGREKPAVPAPYAEEVWTGLEFMSASHMIMQGLIDEGLTVVRGARDRHDGSRRSPWNNLECGSYYARSMSAYALVNAWSGLTIDMTKKHLKFTPKETGDFKLFWSAGDAWGTLQHRTGKFTLHVGGGTIALDQIDIGPFGKFEPDTNDAISTGDTVSLRASAPAERDA